MSRYPSYSYSCVKIVNYGQHYYDGAPYMQFMQPDTTLQNKQANTGESVQIKYKSVYNPHKTLDHYKAPAGDNIAQKNALSGTDETYACKVIKSSLTQHEFWMYYTSCYLKSEGYGLWIDILPQESTQ
eukprot:1922466-Ditylum_brightwellii.AAC.1